MPDAPTVRNERLRPRYQRLLAAGLAIMALTSCFPEPQPGTVDIVGDSILLQSALDRMAEFRAAGSPANGDLDVSIHAWPGAKFEDHVADQRARSERARPEILVIALGANNASMWLGDGWTDDDVRALNALVRSVAPTTCIAFVLPGRVNKTSAPQKEIDQYLAARWAMLGHWQRRLSHGSRASLVDWAGTIEEDPTLVQEDGLHLANDETPKRGWEVNERAADAYAKAMWQGVRQCR